MTEWFRLFVIVYLVGAWVFAADIARMIAGILAIVAAAEAALELWRKR